MEAHDQVQRIEKSKERQKKQEEALEQRKLLRRASQPAMKIGSKVSVAMNACSWTNCESWQLLMGI